MQLIELIKVEVYDHFDGGHLQMSPEDIPGRQGD